MVMSRTKEVWFRLRTPLGRQALLVVGILLGQAVLYGESLCGWKIFLPLDILAQPGVYLPMTRQLAQIVPKNTKLTDPVYQADPAVQFAVREVRSGRLPRWDPCQYAGVPFRWPRFSPFFALHYLFDSPVTLAWRQALAAVVAGLGAYVFCRRVLQVGFWPAALAAWCYPLTGFFVLWEQYFASFSIVWLPWILLAVEMTLCRSPWRWGLLLVLLTGINMIGGQPDVASQVLLASGIYAAGRFLYLYWRRWFSPRALQSAAALAAAWTLGILLATPELFPVVEYSRTGARIIRRSQGLEERPPIGLAALPQLVLPDMYGSTQTGNYWNPPGEERMENGENYIMFLEGNLLESPSAAYAGVLLTLLVAPLAWCSRRHRAMNVLWIVLGVISLAWALNIPGLVSVMRLPGMKMMSHNRFVFVATFALLAMAAVGLELLGKGGVPRRWWFWGPTLLVAGLAAWCLYRTAVLPEPLATEIEYKLLQNQPVLGVANLGQLHEAQWHFCRDYLVAAGLCSLALGGWLVLQLSARIPRWFLPLLGAGLLADLLWFGYGRAPQGDPAFYYPCLPVLDALAAADPPGRIIGRDCLPAVLAETQKLHDVRGYDAVDPARLVDLLLLTATADSPLFLESYTQVLIPQAFIRAPDEVRVHPILDMLNVRYVIFRGSPPAGYRPTFAGPDYWVMTNRSALPRAYVPWRVETVTDDADRLKRMASPGFDPSRVAYVETPLVLPNPCEGTAKIVDEIPTRVTLSLDMKTPGLVVLADRWDAGWNAYLNDRLVPILRTNHALRGVKAPAGKATIEFRYEPASFAWGVRLAAAALLATLGWLGLGLWIGRSDTSPPLQPEPAPATEKPAKTTRRHHRGRRM
jgi:hypothetical protein